MKQFLVLLFFVLLFNVESVQAQNPLYQNGISFKHVFMDYQSQNGGSISDLKSYHRGFEIGYHRKLQDNFNLVVPAHVGVVSRSHDDNFAVDNCLHKTVYGIDAQVQYLFTRPDARVTPYLMLGAGYATEVEGEGNLQIPAGAGLFFQVRDNAYVNWQSSYRYSLADDRNNLHHGLGFVYLFGKTAADAMPAVMEKKDSDGDGLTDDVDLCPQAIGTKELNGCPDLDGDGIADYQDECPNFAGTKALKGCPDSDGDGITDSKDECPSVAGTKANNGCPEEEKDSDGDGVNDSEDRCPNIAGIASNGGCPPVAPPVVVSDRDGDGIADKDDKCPSNFGVAAFGGCPDTDGDGIDDSRDRCPNSAGSANNGGCPEITTQDRSVLDLAMRAVQFDTGKATIKSESYSILNQIADIMNRYPNYNLSIEGHTDNVGSADINQRLSEKRAKATYNYLIQRGISSSRLSYIGYGEVSPISDNNTLKGKALNRRVEFVLRPR